MFHIFSSIIFVYIFIFIGFIAKSIFKERIDSKTLTIVSVYFMQPFVSIWGFSTAKLSISHLYIPLLYLGIIFTLLLPIAWLSKKIYKDPKDRAIFTIAGFVGNTGNIGIPLGLAIFGKESVIYTTLINIANVVVIYGLGAYIYSRGSFSIKQSIKNMLKIPILPASLIAALLNIAGVEYPIEIKEMLKMGAYHGIVLQLFLLGTFLQTIKIKEINYKLFNSVLALKFIAIPLLTYLILIPLPIDNFVKNILLMQMLTPLAVANINLASLYNCKPEVVTALILVSTILFIFVIGVFSYFVAL
jgi:predicted permease